MVPSFRTSIVSIVRIPLVVIPGLCNCIADEMYQSFAPAKPRENLIKLVRLIGHHEGEPISYGRCSFPRPQVVYFPTHGMPVARKQTPKPHVGENLSNMVDVDSLTHTWFTPSHVARRSPVSELQNYICTTV